MVYFLSRLEPSAVNQAAHSIYTGITACERPKMLTIIVLVEDLVSQLLLVKTEAL